LRTIIIIFENQTKTIMRKLIILLLICFSVPGKAQFIQQPDNTIRVQGIFITRETPEQVDFSFTIKYESPELKSCSDSLLIITQEISDILVQNGIEREVIRTSGISVNQNYVYSQGMRIKKGFIGTSRIEIQSILSQELTENVFRSISEFNHDVEYSVRFSFSEQQKDRLRKTSLEKAIDDAREKADIIARSNNLKLSGINRINYDEGGGFSPVHSGFDIVQDEMMDFMGVERAMMPELNLNPKEISIMKSIVIEWKY
jgi:uncharacterized protein